MKFMNLNLLDAMQKIVNRNNIAYKGDLRYDREMMEGDAVEDKQPVYIWMSRELGTQMQNVNDFLMKDCHSSVEHFLHESDCPLVYVVEVTDKETLTGNLYELSIPVAQKLRDNAVKAHPMYHYANGAVLTQENKDELSRYEQGQLGNLMQIEYIPDDQFEMKSARTGLRQRCMNMKEGSFEDYLEKLEQRYKKLHKDRPMKEENILKL